MLNIAMSPHEVSVEEFESTRALVNEIMIDVEQMKQQIAILKEIELQCRMMDEASQLAEVDEASQLDDVDETSQLDEMNEPHRIHLTVLTQERKLKLDNAIALADVTAFGEAELSAGEWLSSQNFCDFNLYDMKIFILNLNFHHDELLE